MGAWLTDAGDINHDELVPDGATWFDRFEPLNGPDEPYVLVERSLVLGFDVLDTWSLA